MVEALVHHRNRLAAALEAWWARTARAYPPVGRAGAFVLEVLRKYEHDDCLSYAASLGFFLLVSLIPITTLLFKLLAVFLGSKAYGPQLQAQVYQLFPYIPHQFMSDTIRHSHDIGGLGLNWIILLVGGNWGLNQLDKSLSHVFGLRIKRHRQTRRFNLLRRVGLLIGALLFLVIFLVGNFEVALRKNALLAPFLKIAVLSPLVGLVLVTMTLQHLPRCHVKFRHALLGASVSTVLWWVAKGGFAIYHDHAFTWGVLYGSLNNLVAGIVFLYISCAIFLLGAVVTATFYRHETGATTVPGSLRIPELIRQGHVELQH